MGNEANGISAEISAIVNRKLTIPRFGEIQQTESLNVATATIGGLIRTGLNHFVSLKYFSLFLCLCTKYTSTLNYHEQFDHPAP